MIALGEIELHRFAEKPLPEGRAVVADGVPTCDPVAVLSGDMLPFCGHKGSAISMMNYFLARVMIGNPNSPEALALLGFSSEGPRRRESIFGFLPRTPCRWTCGD